MIKPIDTNEIPQWIERLKQLMGISIIPSNPQHPLYDHFVEYEKSQGIIKTLNSLPKKVIELGTIAVSVLLFEEDFIQPKERKHVRTHLMVPNLVNGLLFEFRVAVHFLHQHKEVHWMPNIGNESEFDLKVITNSGKIVNIECTRKKDRPNTLEQKDKLINYILNTLVTKKNQINKRKPKLPVLVAIFVPEEIDWEKDDIKSELDIDIPKILQEQSYQIISGISVVCSKLLEKIKLNSLISEYDTGLPVITYRNSQALHPFPRDFYYNLRK